MFEKLQKYKKIVVTGPQRSGTTICSRMIACDTGHSCVDETAFGAENESGWRQVLERNNVVVQCPAMSKLCSDLGNNVLVVFMRRDVGDIMASQSRIDWGSEGHELKKYGAEGDIAQVKYDYWEQNKPANWIDVEYESLKKHPLWIDKQYRKNFSPKQTSL